MISGKVKDAVWLYLFRSGVAMWNLESWHHSDWRNPAKRPQVKKSNSVARSSSFLESDVSLETR